MLLLRREKEMFIFSTPVNAFDIDLTSLAFTGSN